MTANPDQADEHPGGDPQQSGSGRMYLRFAAMILTGMVVMYWTMFAGPWQ